MKLDLLAIGVHPDDVELGCSGTIINEIKLGNKVGVLDLTQGELGSRGTIETRYQESAKAAMIMGVHVRENLKMRDGFFQNDEDHQRRLIVALRKFQPEVVITNSLNDRHPDHGRAGKLTTDSCYLSGLRKVQTTDEDGREQEPWRPKYVFHYIQDRYHEPDFIIDISAVFEQRMEAIKAYTTQFYNPDNEDDGPQTYISTSAFLESVIARARVIGKKIGVQYAEGFNTEKSLGIKSLDSLIKIET
ncbi:MAG TPA: bacillithiol biosynthesis deacetylase BshB1 [Chitinophagaceae bacterium]